MKNRVNYKCNSQIHKAQGMWWEGDYREINPAAGLTERMCVVCDGLICMPQRGRGRTVWPECM